MNGTGIIRTILLLAWLSLAAGCDIDGDLPECKWNVSIDYTYAPYGKKLLLGDYMAAFRYYVFNEQGVLVDTGEEEKAGTAAAGSAAGAAADEGRPAGKGITCAPGQIRFKLPPGRYTAVAWGNIGSNTAPLSGLLPGVSTLQELLLRRKATASVPDPLYYGAIPFEVSEGLSHYEASLTDAFARLSFVVHWSAGQQPPKEELKGLNLRLTQAPSTLSFTPGTQVQAYRNDVARFLPATAEPTGTYRQSVTAYDGVMESTFTIARLAKDDHPVFCLYAGDVPLMKEIDLHRFFTETETDFEGDCIQEYGLDVEIGDGTVIVSLISLGGWEEGGNIGLGW